jgi:WD40 repeat protein
VATGQEKVRPEGHLQAITQVAYLADGQALATISGDGSARFWDLASHKELRHIEHLAAPRLSSDGRHLAAMGSDGRLGVWATGTTELLWRTKAPVRPTAVALSADGKLLASSQGDGFIHLANADDGTEIRKLRGLRMPPTRLAFSPDSTLLAGQSGRMLLLWDVADREPMPSIDLQTPLHCELIFAPDGRSLATIAGDNAVRLWEVASRQLRASFAGHRNGVSATAFSADGKLLITAGLDRTLRSWDLTTGEAWHPLQQSAVATALAWSPDGRTLASGNDDTTALLWDTGRLRGKSERPAVRLNQSTEDRLWTELSGDNVARAYAAMRRLAETGGAAGPGAVG